MKTFKIIFVLLTFSFLVISCSSDNNESEAVVYNEENPFDVYMSISGFRETTAVVRKAGFFEMGFSFIPIVNGKINSFAVRTPDVNNALRITLWDAETKKNIKSETIDVSAVNVFIEKAVAPITLMKGKEYFLSINTDDYYLRKNGTGADVSFPIVAGNIIVTGNAYTSNTGIVISYPINSTKNYYTGDITFKFQQTE